MSNNTEIKEFKTELCAQPKSRFLIIFNFGRSLTRCTWAVFLILNYTCNSSWSEWSWGAKIHLLVADENAGHVLKPAFLLHVRHVCTVLPLDSSKNKQTCEINCLAPSWQRNHHMTYFLFLPGCSVLESKTVKLKCMKQMIKDRRGSLIRPRVYKCPAGLPALSFNRIEEDEE